MCPFNGLSNKLNPFFGFIYTWMSGLGLLSPKFSFVISPFCLSLYKPFSNSFIPAHTYTCVCVFFNGSHSSRWPSPLESLSKHKCHLIQRGVSPFHVSTAAMTSLGRRKKIVHHPVIEPWKLFQRTLDRDTLDKPNRLNRREELFIVLFQWNSISTSHVVRDFSSKRRADSNRLLDCPWAPSLYVYLSHLGSVVFIFPVK